MKNILVTGATGYLGNKVTANLAEKGVNLICCSRGRKKADKILRNVHYSEGDISNSRYVDSVFASNIIDCVIHLAAETEYGDETGKIQRMIRTNVLGTANILRAMVRYKIKNLIFSSSMSVIGVPSYLPVDEKHPSEPVNLYGLTKKHAEDMIKYFSGRYGIASYIFRFPGLFGADRMSGAVYTFIKNALDNKNLEIELDQPVIWDILHVDDAAMTIVDSVKRIKDTVGCSVFNIGYGEPVEIEALAKKIVLLAKSNSKVSVHGNAPSHAFCFDSGKATRGLELRLPKLEERIKEFMEWVKEHDKADSV